jgi:hypothetical protein
MKGSAVQIRSPALEIAEGILETPVDGGVEDPRLFSAGSVLRTFILAIPARRGNGA